MHVRPPKWNSYRGQRDQGSSFHTRSSPGTKAQTQFCGRFAPVLSSLASANPRAAAQGSHGQRPPCRHIFSGQKGPSFHVTFITQSGQTILANSSSSQPDRLLCWKDFLLCQQGLGNREEHLERSGTQLCSATSSPFFPKTREHHASRCSPSTRNKHPGKHSLTEATIQEEIWTTESRKTCFSNTHNTTERSERGGEGVCFCFFY